MKTLIFLFKKLINKFYKKTFYKKTFYEKTFYEKTFYKKINKS